MVVALASFIPVTALDAVLLLTVYTTCMDTTICTSAPIWADLIGGSLASGGDTVSALLGRGRGFEMRRCDDAPSRPDRWLRTSDLCHLCESAIPGSSLCERHW
jgi:hypothetical protein